jgi:hypothetical protein
VGLGACGAWANASPYTVRNMLASFIFQNLDPYSGCTNRAEGVK